MTEQHKTHTSKLLSLVLRHSPQTIAITLDENGWVAVSELLTALQQHNEAVTLTELEEIVATNSKQRFAFSEDKLRIRANQGHSVEVDMKFEAVQPPEQLYHGTVAATLQNIGHEGLRAMKRQHVHLSADMATAEKVGARHGKPMILTINSGEMHRNGGTFYLSANGVWLTDNVPVLYINFPDHGE
ncbi:MAG: RNA 2'-phosphotransferase [Bacteroidota bacterium]